MNKETYEALKKTMHHCEYGGANDKEFWDNFRQVESWIDEVAKEYTDGGEQDELTQSEQFLEDKNNGSK